MPVLRTQTDGSMIKKRVQDEIAGPTGPQGPQGALGATGPIGDTGIKGITGPTGPQGITGSQGVQGIQGITGDTGSQGITGSQGVQGNQGDTGVQGSQGITGTQGEQGVQGEQGNTGSQGITGTQGEQGVQGDQGNTGSQGITGSQGEQGEQGEQGITGNTGNEGPQGDQGNTGVQGIQGITGTTGFQGSQGNTGTQGSTGVQGNTGVQGSQGNTGVQGAQGITGGTGAQGVQGLTGIVGDTLAHVISFITGGYIYQNKPTYGATAQGWWIGMTGGKGLLHFGDNNHFVKYDGLTGINTSGLTITSGSTGQRIEISATDNEQHFYGNRGDGTYEELATIGIRSDVYDNVIGTFGSSNSIRIGIAAVSNSSLYTVVGQNVDETANGGCGVKGIANGGPGVFGSSANFDGGYFYPSLSVGAYNYQYLQIVPSTSTLANSGGALKMWTYADEAMADEDYVDLPGGTTGFILFSATTVANDDAAGSVQVKHDSVIAWISEVGDCKGTDLDAFFCVFDNGTNVRCKNRLGGAAEVRIVYFYN